MICIKLWAAGWLPHLLFPASWQSWVNQSSTLVWLLLGQHAWHQLSLVFQFPDLHIKWGIRRNGHFCFTAMANTQSLFSDFQVLGPLASCPCPFSSDALFLWWWDFQTPNIQNQTNAMDSSFSNVLVPGTNCHKTCAVDCQQEFISGDHDQRAFFNP